MRIPPRVLPVGTRLRREWHGGIHEVTITYPAPKPERCRARLDEQRGHWRYIYKGERYRSLSAIAYVITGDRTYSGNRFFGLTPRVRGGGGMRTWKRLQRNA